MAKRIQSKASFLKNPPRISAELKSAVETYILAKAYCEEIKPIVRGYQAAILAEHRWDISSEWKAYGEQGPILNPEHTYLLAPADFETYHNLVQAEHAKHGFTVEGDKCPYLVADSNVTIMRKQVLAASKYIHNVDVDSIWKMELIDELTRIVVSLVVSLTGITAESVTAKRVTA